MRTRAGLIVGVALTIVAGCTETSPCDPGFVHAGSVCVAAGDDGGGSGGDALASEDGAGMSDGGAIDSTADTQGTVENWGAACAGDAECTGGPADFCAKQPGAASGYCSKQGCDTMPSICPSMWGCLDLRMFGGTYAVCTRPSP